MTVRFWLVAWRCGPYVARTMFLVGGVIRFLGAVGARVRFALRTFRMALTSLRANLLRSLLATLGVIIGVSAVISAFSIIAGMRRDLLTRFESMGADQMYIMNGSSDRTRRTVVAPSLELDDLDAIQKQASDLVRATCPQIQRSGQIEPKNIACTVMGTSESFASINNYAAEEGEFLSAADIASNGSFNVVLGHQVKEDVFGALPALGKQVRLNGKTFNVIGVMEERGFIGLTEVDSMVFVPVTTMLRISGVRYLDLVVVKAVEVKRLNAAIDAVSRVLRESHRLRAGLPDDFVIYTQEQAKSQLADVTLILGVVLYSIAGISLVVGGIGIMNIMMVSVTERTREIGVRIAVGARPFDILAQFFIEAGVISLFGGIAGVLMGYAFTDLLTQITGILKTYTPPWSIAWALGMAFVVGLISGLYPAIRAARMDPVDALRFE